MDRDRPPTQENIARSDTSHDTTIINGNDEGTQLSHQMIQHEAHAQIVDFIQLPSSVTPAEPMEKDIGAAHVQRGKGRIALIMLSLCVATLLAALDVSIVTTALPSIAKAFDSTSAYIWVGSAYLLATSAATPVWGKLSDIFGRKPTLLSANALFFIGSLVCGLANSVGMLIAGRTIQGLGGGGLLVLCNIVIGDLFSEAERAGYYGMLGGVWAVALAMGPVVGGAFSQNVSWRWW